MPKVSVIVPAYNNGPYIGECIQSVLDQSFQDFELIIVDDGSTDDTEDIVKSFSDCRISYIRQENQGPCVARNTGILTSTGEFLVFLDSDDMIMKNAVEKGIAILEQNPDVGLHYGNSYPIDLSGRLKTNVRMKREPGIWPGIREIKHFLDRGNAVGMGIVRRSVVMEVGLFNPFFTEGSNDFDLWVRIAKKMATSYVYEPMIIYRRHGNSITHRRTIKNYFRAHRRIYADIFRDPIIGPQVVTMRKSSYFRLHYRFAEYAYSREANELARKHLKKAFCIYPKAFRTPSAISGLYLLLKTIVPANLLRKIRSVRENFLNFVLHDKRIN